MSEYQRIATSKGYPVCKVCGLRMPVALTERGVCDFCTWAGYQPDGTYPAHWPAEILNNTDATAYEQDRYRGHNPAMASIRVGGVNNGPEWLRNEQIQGTSPLRGGFLSDHSILAARLAERADRRRKGHEDGS